MGTQFANIGQQLQAFQGALRDRGVAREFDALRPKMIDAMGEELETLVLAVFDTRTAPDGSRWEAYSPLTLAIYREDGVVPTLGGEKLRDSFKVRGGGNLWKPGKWGFAYGSVLRGSGKGSAYFVARTFQERYTIPRDGEVMAVAGTGPGAMKQRRIEQHRALVSRRQAASKGDRVRRWMAAKTGWAAPAPGSTLQHPARKILAWTPRWVSRMETVVETHLTEAVVKAKRNVEAQVRASQRMYDAARRIA